MDIDTIIIIIVYKLMYVHNYVERKQAQCYIYISSIDNQLTGNQLKLRHLASR